MKNKFIQIATYILLAAMTAFCVFILFFEKERILVPYNKTVVIPEMNKTIFNYKIDSIKTIQKAEFEKKLSAKLNEMTPEVKEKIITVLKDHPENKPIEIISTKSILYDTLNIYGNKVFNKYEIGVKTIGYPPIQVDVNRFETSFTFRDTIYVQEYKSKLKRLKSLGIKLALGAIIYKSAEALLNGR